MTGGTLLEVESLSAGYHGHPVVHDLTFAVHPGQIVALIGANGAGKTTTLMALAGAIPPLGGTLRLLGQTTRAPLHVRARRGMSYVADDRGIFRDLSVADNFKVSGGDYAPALELFPELEPLWNRRVGLLSGGEQQMVATGRAIARRPHLLLVDELSLGLAPKVVRRLMTALRAAADEGMGVLMVEQYVRQALSVADQVCVMSRGRIVLAGSSASVAGRLNEVEASYFTASADIGPPRVLGTDA